MRKFFEFVIFDTDTERRVLRFYPGTTHVHGFDDVPPKSWKDVYKVYLSFDVIHKDKEYNTSKVVYSARWDECSALDAVAETLLDPSLLEKPVQEVWALGYATQWIIVPRESSTLITMYPMNGGLGYTFIVCTDRLAELGNTINEYLAMALENSEGI